MDHLIYIIMISFVLSVSLLITVIISKSRIIKELNDTIDQKNRSTKITFKTIADISDRKNETMKDLRDLEDSINTSHGIKIRQDITNVRIDFSKVELVFIGAGIAKLLKETADPFDAEYYINLLKKISNILPDMKEEEIKQKEP